MYNIQISKLETTVGYHADSGAPQKVPLLLLHSIVASEREHNTYTIIRGVTAKISLLKDARARAAGRG